jgi:hypothetical protein
MFLKSLIYPPAVFFASKSRRIGLAELSFGQALHVAVLVLVAGVAAVDNYSKVIRAAVHLAGRLLRSRNAAA